jgi:hypothetical protein
MVSVLAIAPKVRGFKPGRGQWIFKDVKICSTPSFGGDVKPSAPCRKILQHVKNPLEVWTGILRKVKFIISFASSFYIDARWLLVRLPESFGGLVSNFPLPISFHHGFLYSCITCWMKNMAAVQRRSLTVLTWSSSTAAVRAASLSQSFSPPWKTLPYLSGC